jgi:hypothetical protein
MCVTSLRRPYVNVCDTVRKPNGYVCEVVRKALCKCVRHPMEFLTVMCVTPLDSPT